MNTYFSGSAVSVYREGDNAIPIVFRAGADTHSIEGVTNMIFVHNGASFLSLRLPASSPDSIFLASAEKTRNERSSPPGARP